VTATGNESPGLLDSATPANRITLNGAGNYSTIQQAINAAAPGGVVRALAGTYPENLTLPPGVTVIGASPGHTILAPAGGTVVTVTGTFGVNPQSSIRSVGVTGGAIGIAAASADLLVVNVLVHHVSSHGISAGLGSRLTGVNCTLAHNGGDGVVALNQAFLRNVIAASNVGFGINAPAASSLVTYCDSYGNPSGNYTAGIVNGSDFSVPVAFTNEAANDYTELFGAVSIDAGDPNDPFALEPTYNGGRINQGAFGNTEWAGRSPPPPPLSKGGGGGGCGLTGLEVVGLLALLRMGRRRRA